MKFMIVVALALVAVAVALPVQDQAAPVLLLNSEFEQDPEGSYRSSFATNDGTSRQEEGQLKEVLDEEKKPHTVVVVRGSYTYVDPEGKTETIEYEADENGFRPQGPSIPQAPARR